MWARTRGHGQCAGAKVKWMHGREVHGHTNELLHWLHKYKMFRSSAIDWYHKVHFKEHDILCWKIMAPYIETIYEVHADSIENYIKNKIEFNFCTMLLLFILLQYFIKSWTETIITTLSSKYGGEMFDRTILESRMPLLWIIVCCRGSLH
jgi:hypothetical protein